MSSVHLGDLARFVTLQTRDSHRGNNFRDEEWEDEQDEEDSPEDTDYFPPVNEAQKEGEELLHSGDFGRIGIKIRSRANNRNFVKLVLNQATHPIPNFHREDLLSVCLNLPYPNHELNVLFTRTSFQTPMELLLQPTMPTCTPPNFQTAH